MLRHAWSLLLLASLTVTSFAQTGAQTELDVAERNRLRELLRISATAEFSQQLKTPLPAQKSYRVFLGFGLDFPVRNNLARWIEEWNRKEGTRSARLEVTEDIKQAHIVLARYLGDESILDVTTFGMKTEAGVYDKANTQREYYANVYSYLFVPLKTSPLHLQAIWRDYRQVKRRAKEDTDDQGKDAGWRLRSALFNLLKRNQPPR
jgi:hypothetical protein